MSGAEELETLSLFFSRPSFPRPHDFGFSPVFVTWDGKFRIFEIERFTSVTP